jgi:hypothetical protein
MSCSDLKKSFLEWKSKFIFKSGIFCFSYIFLAFHVVHGNIINFEGDNSKNRKKAARNDLLFGLSE